MIRDLTRRINDRLATKWASAELRPFLDRDHDGWVSFCYPAFTGALLAQHRRIGELLAEIMAMKPKYRAEKLAELSQLAARYEAEHGRIGAEWDRLRDRREKLHGRLFNHARASFAA